VLDQFRQAQPPRVSGTRGPATRSRASDLRAPGLMRRA